jgi:endonuclease/exonuclease/phosphatase family metal-dependent hydrolase
LLLDINDSKVNLINIYNALEADLNAQYLDLIAALPNLLLVGDFNAHHPCLNSNSTNKAGKIISDLLENTELVLLNNKIPTHFSYQGLSRVLDLSILFPSLGMKSQFHVIQQPMASDHFPVQIIFN